MRLFSAMLFVLLFTFSCGNNDDLLAVYNGGDIKRSELKDWLAARNIAPDKVFKDGYAVEDFLRQLAVEKLTALRAERDNYYNNKTFRVIEKTLYDNLLSEYYLQKNEDKITFTEKGYDFSVIRIFFKNENHPQYKMEKARKELIINAVSGKLSAGEDFNELAARFSEDALASKKGHAGVMPESLMEEDVVKILAGLGENEYTASPVLIGNSYSLFKLHKIHVLNQDNIRDIVSDEKLYQRLISYYKNSHVDNLCKRIEKGCSVTYNTHYNRSNGLIFEINGESFRVDELDIILELFYSLKNGYPPSQSFSREEKEKTVEKIFRERLVASEAVRISLNFDEGFISKWNFLKRASLAGAYKHSVLSRDVSLTGKDFLKEYEIRKKSAKTSRGLSTDGHVQYKSYHDELPRIKNNLYRQKLGKLKRDWDRNILAESGFLLKKKADQLIE